MKNFPEVEDIEQSSVIITTNEEKDLEKKNDDTEAMKTQKEVEGETINNDSYISLLVNEMRFVLFRSPS